MSPVLPGERRIPRAPILSFRAEPPLLPAAVLKLLGPPPGWKAKESLEDRLTPVLRSAGQLARAMLHGEGADIFGSNENQVPGEIQDSSTTALEGEHSMGSRDAQAETDLVALTRRHLDGDMDCERFRAAVVALIDGRMDREVHRSADDERGQAFRRVENDLAAALAECAALLPPGKEDGCLIALYRAFSTWFGESADALVIQRRGDTSLQPVALVRRLREAAWSTKDEVIAFRLGNALLDTMIFNRAENFGFSMAEDRETWWADWLRYGEMVLASGGPGALATFVDRARKTALNHGHLSNLKPLEDLLARGSTGDDGRGAAKGRKADKDLMTPAEAAKYAGVSMRTLARWEASGELRPDQTKGGHRRYRKEDLDAVLARRSAKGGNAGSDGPTRTPEKRPGTSPRETSTSKKRPATSPKVIDIYELGRKVGRNKKK